jgi:hypothetical protein
MNPFTNPIYNIYESSKWDSCSGNSSKIVSSTVQQPTGNYQNIIKSKDLFYIESYISEELSKLIKKIYLIKRCDNYGISMNLNPNIAIPNDCNIFTNFSRDKINTIRNDIEQNRNYSAYKTQINPSSNIFEKIKYTDTYINSQTNDNDKKELCQRFSDLSNMLNDYNTIISVFNRDDIKSTYKDDYDTINANYKKNMILRNELSNKVNELYFDEGSRIGNSKLYLDSTVYTSILWTILATTVLFYVFKKL